MKTIIVLILWISILEAHSQTLNVEDCINYDVFNNKNDIQSFPDSLGECCIFTYSSLTKDLRKIYHRIPPIHCLALGARRIHVFNKVSLNFMAKDLRALVIFEGVSLNNELMYTDSLERLIIYRKCNAVPRPIRNSTILKHVTLLRLKRNKGFGNLPISIESLSIFHDSELDTLPIKYFSLPNLKELYVSSNMCSFPSNMPVNRSIIRMSANIDFSKAENMEKLKLLTSLRELDLGEFEIKNLEIFEAFSEIEAVYLWNRIDFNLYKKINEKYPNIRMRPLGQFSLGE